MPAVLRVARAAGGERVDFVVVGLGLGALSILAGVLLLGVLAGRWERVATNATSPEDAAYGFAMAAGRRGAGQALLGAGGALILATVGALAGSLDDRTGAYLVTTTATVAAVGLLVWAYLHRAHNPAPPRRRAHPPRSSAAPEGAGLSGTPVPDASPHDREPPKPGKSAEEGAGAIVSIETEDPRTGSAAAESGQRAPYSFMIDDSVPTPETRTAPYSFMEDTAPPEGDDAPAPALDAEPEDAPPHPNLSPESGVDEPPDPSPEPESEEVQKKDAS
jgi:hypothetical protein